MGNFWVTLGPFWDTLAIFFDSKNGPEDKGAPRGAKGRFARYPLTRLGSQFGPQNLDFLKQKRKKLEKRRSQKGSSKKVMFLVPFGWPGPSRIKLPLKRELNPALYHSFAIWSPKDLQKGVKMEVKTEKIAFKGEK